MIKIKLINALVVAGVAFCCNSAANSAAPSQAPESEWALIGGGPLEQHFSPLAQVNDSNVGVLGLAWFTGLESADGPTGIPLVAGGLVYQSGPMGKVWAHDARTGRLLWT